MNKKFVYQVGNNKKVILWCMANQMSRLEYSLLVGDWWWLVGDWWWLVRTYCYLYVLIFVNLLYLCQMSLMI